LASYRFCRFGGFGFPTWFFRGPFFAATLVAYVAVSPITNLITVFFRLGIEDVLDFLHELIHLGDFWGDFSGPIGWKPCLETPWKHPEEGKSPMFGDIFFAWAELKCTSFRQIFLVHLNITLSRKERSSSQVLPSEGFFIKSMTFSAGRPKEPPGRSWCAWIC